MGHTAVVARSCAYWRAERRERGRGRENVAIGVPAAVTFRFLLLRGGGKSPATKKCLPGFFPSHYPIVPRKKGGRGGGGGEVECPRREKPPLKQTLPMSCSSPRREGKGGEKGKREGCRRIIRVVGVNLASYIFFLDSREQRRKRERERASTREKLIKAGSVRRMTISSFCSLHFYIEGGKKGEETANIPPTQVVSGSPYILVGSRM